MIIRSLLLIALIGHTEDGVRRVEPDAPLEAAGRHVAAVALQTDLVDQVVRAVILSKSKVRMIDRKKTANGYKRCDYVSKKRAVSFLLDTTRLL